VLLVEDSEADAALLLRELRREGFQPDATRVDSAASLTEALADGPWDVILSDHNLPGFSSRDALLLARHHLPDVPVIVVSGTVEEEYAVEAMRSGASDFVSKTRLHRLAPVIERELRESAKRAEQRRTAQALEESQQQLRQAQKLEAIGRLAGGIAHDFNNLLTAIIGYADIVLSTVPRDHPIHADVSEIRQAGARAAELTRQLLAFSRQRVVDASVIDLNNVVEEAVRLLKRVIGQDIVLRADCASDLWFVKLDPTQATQVLMNLALNARDAMPAGGSLDIATGNVRITGSNRPNQPARAGDYVRVTVRDSGEGMSAEVMSRIFEPFFTTKEPGRGTGLGLPMVYGIVQQSEGSVFVDSEVGVGTEFTLYFPRTVQRPVTVAPSALPSHRRGTETVLVVEDEPSLLELSSRVLRQAGYRVLTTGSPEEAVDTARRHHGPIDLLLTEVVMAGRSGPALAAELRRDRPSMRVVFVSGFRGESRDVLDRVGPADVLAKPFTPAGLVERVRGALVKAAR
jgi:signal transduction histidine kinase